MSSADEQGVVIDGVPIDAWMKVKAHETENEIDYTPGRTRSARVEAKAVEKNRLAIARALTAAFAAGRQAEREGK